MKRQTFNLHFTDYCNFKCKHCFVEKEGNELSLNEIKIIVDKLEEYSKKTNKKIRINLAGGEPLVSKNIQSIIDYIYSKGIEVSMISNGFYLSNEFIKENQNKLSMIGLSIDSLNYDTNIRMGRCEREKTLTKAEIIDKCLLIKNIGIKLKINICITSNNKDEDFDDFFKKVNPDRIKILRVLCDHNDALKSISISDDEWQIVQETFKKYTKIFEDNDYMKSRYIIIDSKGNMTKNNLHLENNSIFQKSIFDCLEHLNSVKEV